jgi:hypothetical protein
MDDPVRQAADAAEKVVGWWDQAVPKWIVALLVLGGFLIGTLVGKLG